MRVGKDSGAAPLNPAGEKNGRLALRDDRQQEGQPETPSATPRDTRGLGQRFDRLFGPRVAAAQGFMPRAIHEFRAG